MSYSSKTAAENRLVVNKERTSMFDRLEAAWRALTARQVIVITKGYQFSTYDNSNCVQSDGYIRVEVKSPTP